MALGTIWVLVGLLCLPLIPLAVRIAFEAGGGPDVDVLLVVLLVTLFLGPITALCCYSVLPYRARVGRLLAIGAGVVWFVVVGRILYESGRFIGILLQAGDGAGSLELAGVIVVLLFPAVITLGLSVSAAAGRTFDAYVHQGSREAGNVLMQ